jgi:DNA-binding CsgD family transcriptional regulator
MVKHSKAAQSDKEIKTLAIAREAHKLAQAISNHMALCHQDLLTQIDWLDALEARFGYMMLLHRSDVNADAIYLGLALRSRYGLEAEASLCTLDELMKIVGVRDQIRVCDYCDHFRDHDGGELFQVTKATHTNGGSEWLISYSVRVAIGPAYIVTLLCPLLEHLRSVTPLEQNPSEAGPEWVEKISPREKEVLSLISQGHRSAAIADKLNISPLTVKTHRQALMAKMKVNNVAAMVRLAMTDYPRIMS